MMTASRGLLDLENAAIANANMRGIAWQTLKNSVTTTQIATQQTMNTYAALEENVILCLLGIIRMNG